MDYISQIGRPSSKDMTLNLIFYGLLLLVFIYLMLRRYGFFNFSDRSLIASKNILENTIPGSVYVSKMAGYNYNFIAGKDGRSTAFILLDKDTGIHLIAIGGKSGIDSQLSKATLRRRLQKVDLEGDFPNFFTMYCSKGHEQELLELFDPGEMALFADFCQAYDFELYKDCIYVSKAGGANDPADETSMTSDLKVFLERNNRWLKGLQGTT